jgi:hypothetical protein
MLLMQSLMLLPAAAAPDTDTRAPALGPVYGPHGPLGALDMRLDHLGPRPQAPVQAAAAAAAGSSLLSLTKIAT